MEQNDASELCVPEWPDEWASRPASMLDEHVPFPSHGNSFDDVYDMSLESGNLDDWERSTSSLSMDFTPSFADPYGHKPVLPETHRT